MTSLGSTNDANGIHLVVRSSESMGLACVSLQKKMTMILGPTTERTHSFPLPIVPPTKNLMGQLFFHMLEMRMALERGLPLDNKIWPRKFIR